jgi:hypothetical protein
MVIDERNKKNHQESSTCKYQLARRGIGNIDIPSNRGPDHSDAKNDKDTDSPKQPEIKVMPGDFGDCCWLTGGVH